MDRLTKNNYEDDLFELQKTRKVKVDEYTEIGYTQHNYNEDLWNIVKYIEDREEELGIDLITLFKAIKNGFYYIKNNEIKFCRWCVRVGNCLVETKPCYAVKETTIQSCYYGDVSELKQVTDAHYWDWDSSLHVRFKDYGKTWALTKEELL